VRSTTNDTAKLTGIKRGAVDIHRRRIPAKPYFASLFDTVGVDANAAFGSDAEF
jgi:hypothetical protein